MTTGEGSGDARDRDAAQRDADNRRDATQRDADRRDATARDSDNRRDTRQPGPGLSTVGTRTLERLREALVHGDLAAPFDRGDLIAFGVGDQLAPLRAALAGHGRAACLSVLDAALAERARLERPAPELVWTGPESTRTSARDTAVVLRELFESARDRVVLAGYSFVGGQEVLRPLHAVMARHGVRATFFVDIDQPVRSKGPAPDPAEHAREQLEAFLAESWPFGEARPEVYCDRRSCVPGPPWTSLHAKCVVVDGRRAFLGSANFTERGQERNVEAGVLVEDPAFAAQLERQMMGLPSAPPRGIIRAAVRTISRGARDGERSP